jgi:hypothetical protein
MEPVQLQPLEHDASARFRPSPDVVYRRVGDEAVLVPLRKGVGDLDWVHTLSPVAARVWQLIANEARTTTEIARVICAEYQVDAQTAEADVADLLRTLCDAGLARVAS